MSKIEHTVRGDAMRGLSSSGALELSGQVHVLLEHANRAETSFGVDLTTDEGTDLLYRLAAACDVLLTNKAPARRTKLRHGPGWRPAVAEDPQTTADDYVMELESADGVAFRLVTVPVPFDGEAAQPRRAPRLRENGDSILTDELGLDWDTVVDLKVRGVIA